MAPGRLEHWKDQLSEIDNANTDKVELPVFEGRDEEDCAKFKLNLENIIITC